MNQKASFGSFLVGLYIFSVPVLSYSTDLDLNSFPQYLGALNVLYAIYVLIKTRQLYKNNPMFLFLLFTFWSILTFILAKYQSMSQANALLTLVKVNLITFSVSVLIRNKYDFLLVLSFLFISIFFAVWLNLESIFTLGNLDKISGSERFSGTFANANTAALYGSTIIWSGSTLLMTKNQNWIVKLIILIGIIFALFIIAYSGSRKGFIGMGLFSILFSWVIFRKFGNTKIRKVLIFLISLGLICGIILLIYNSPFYYRIQTMLKGEASMNVRVYLFNEAIDLWISSLKNLLVGVGFDNFRLYSNLRLYSHSTISETLACTGIVGFIFYFGALFSLVILYIQLIKKGVSSSSKIIAMLVFVFLLIILFFNTADVLFSDRLLLPLLGIISSYGILSKKSVSLNEKSITIY